MTWEAKPKPPLGSVRILPQNETASINQQVESLLAAQVMLKTLEEAVTHDLTAMRGAMPMLREAALRTLMVTLFEQGFGPDNMLIAYEQECGDEQAPPA